jgi:hypothetical protein
VKRKEMEKGKKKRMGRQRIEAKRLAGSLKMFFFFPN